MILDYETLAKIQTKFSEYENVIAYTDGSSIRNPGRVSYIIVLTIF